MLTDDQKRLYARHVLLEPLGEAGQAQLCAARVRVAASCDPRAAAVAREYLERAGVEVVTAETAAQAPGAIDVETRTPDAIRALAGDDALADCAAWLDGAFTAVEAIKRIASVGGPGRIDDDVSLTSEISG